MLWHNYDDETKPFHMKPALIYLYNLKYLGHVIYSGQRTASFQKPFSTVN